MNGLSKYYIKKIISCFALEITATETAKKLKVNRNTVNKYFRIIREALLEYQMLQLKNLSMNTSDKQYLFGWHKNDGLVYSPVEDAQMFSLITNSGKVFIKQEPANFSKNTTESVHLPLVESGNIPAESSNGKNPIPNTSTGKEIFKGYLTGTNDPAFHFFMYAKQKLLKFYGVKEEYTYLYLKELEFRFNHTGRDLSNLILKLLPHHSPEWNRTTKHRR